MPMLVSDPHSSCLRCLGEVHVRERCQICRNFKPRMKKDREARLRAILMEAALRPVSEPSRLDSAPSTLASVRSAPPELHVSRHCSPSLVPRKKHKKQRSERGCSPVLKKGMFPAPGPPVSLGGKLTLLSSTKLSLVRHQSLVPWY